MTAGRPDLLTTSASLYFSGSAGLAVPRTWLSDTRAFFTSHRLPTREFAILADGFSLEFPYKLEEHQERLLRAVEGGGVSVLGLYAAPGHYDDLMVEWLGCASVQMEPGTFYLGIERALLDSPGALLRCALTIARDLPTISYGIGYHYPRSKGPDYYTGGIIYGANATATGPVAEVEARRITAWGNEMSGNRSYLDGWFRGAYPASILSEAHVNAPLHGGGSLRTARLGRLTALDLDHWLWELSESEIPVAKDLLKKSGLLICP